MQLCREQQPEAHPELACWHAVCSPQGCAGLHETVLCCVLGIGGPALQAEQLALMLMKTRLQTWTLHASQMQVACNTWSGSRPLHETMPQHGAASHEQQPFTLQPTLRAQLAFACSATLAASKTNPSTCSGTRRLPGTMPYHDYHFTAQDHAKAGPAGCLDQAQQSAFTNIGQQPASAAAERHRSHLNASQTRQPASRTH